MKIKIRFNDNTNKNLEKTFRNLIERVAEQTLLSEDIDINAEISVSFVDNEEIRRINKKFRRIDKETDVLSFPLIDFKRKHEFARDTFYEIGDIIISYEKALEQADKYNHSIEREIAFLAAHSMLHLLGYDHIAENEETIMFSKQESILNALNIGRYVD